MDTQFDACALDSTYRTDLHGRPSGHENETRNDTAPRELRVHRLSGASKIRHDNVLHAGFNTHVGMLALDDLHRSTVPDPLLAQWILSATTVRAHDVLSSMGIVRGFVRRYKGAAGHEARRAHEDLDAAHVASSGVHESVLRAHRQPAMLLDLSRRVDRNVTAIIVIVVNRRLVLESLPDLALPVAALGYRT